MLFEQAREYIINKLRNELPGHLTYHNIDHTLDVYNAAKQIGDAENITDQEMQLLLTAALLHDSGYLVRALGHEEESCRIAKEILPGYQYTADETGFICNMIMATRIPQSPKNHLEKILADADLDYLGRDDFFIIGHKLFLELSASGIICDENDWNRSQVQFMEGHRYFTNTSIKLRRAKKLCNIAEIKAQLIKP